MGGPNSERYILDSRGALVERRAVVSRERLILGHCLVLSLLVVRASKLFNNTFLFIVIFPFSLFMLFAPLIPLILIIELTVHVKEFFINCSSVLLSGTKDVKDIFTILKDSVAEIGGNTDIVKNEVYFELFLQHFIAVIVTE